MHVRTLLFVAGVCLGIVSGYFSSIASELGMAALILGIIEFTLFWIARKRNITGVALSLYIALLSYGFFLGTVRAQLVPEQPIVVCDTSCSFTGKVTRSPERKDAYQLLSVQALTSLQNAYDIQVRAPLYPQVRIGEAYSFTGKVMAPSPSYPHEGKSSFDYASYLRTHDIGSEMMFPHMELIDQDAHTLGESLGRWKEIMIGRLVSYVASPSSLLASGMLFGDSSLPQGVKDSFRTAGLSHIVVLSGFNIAIVISFILFLFRFVPLMFRVFLASFFVIAFVMMVGAEASVIRATLMAFVGLLALAVGRQYVARQALVLSFLAVVLYDPFALLHDVSLHLSFLATAGIIYVEASCSRLLERWIRYASMRGLLSTTLAAYLATLPYVAHVFGSVSPYALLANMLVLPFVPAMMLVSFITVLASFVSYHVALVFGFAVSIMGSFILAVAKIVAALPYSTLSLSGIGALLFSVSCLGIGSLLIRSRHKNETSETPQGNYLTDVITY